jgi:phosphoribosylformylglycinamidine cyclo-ligase
VSDPKLVQHYKDAGVNIHAGDALVGRIGPMARRTLRAGVLAGIGGFGALFELPQGYREPVLVSGTDGVGTKLRLAFALGRHDTVGVDLVAMSVNDILVQGAEPLFFLDYFACGKLDVEQAATVVGGIARGCELAGCALIGGETAEMPDSYPPGEYDLAGFALGVVEKSRIVDGRAVCPGDLILGLASSGVHSNGFSLVRRILERRFGAITPETLAGTFSEIFVAKLEGGEVIPGETIRVQATSGDDGALGRGRTLADALMEPTKIYVRSLLGVLQDGLIRAAAHITGGGIVGNLPRVLPADVAAHLDAHAWPRPALFDWLQDAAGVDDAEMYRVFNCGLGMLLVVESAHLNEVCGRLRRAGESVFTVGRVVRRDPGAPQVRLG